MISNSKSQKHISVLLDESIEGLNIKRDGIYVDATLGRAGHSLEILRRLSDLGKLYSFDQDIEAIETSDKWLLAISPRYELIHSNFKFLKEELEKRKVEKVDGILFDLGVSSPQLDNGERGFSYNFDSRLDMRMDQSKGIDAYTVVNKYKEDELSKILFEYGEERFAKKIAKNIVAQRNIKEIETTFELVDVIKRSLPSFALKGGHPAKKTFQAIRIVVNDELNALKEALKKSLTILNKNGRIVVITFHSLEDRIVKNIFNEVSKPKSVNRYEPISYIEEEKLEFELVNKKVILPSEEELENNRRSHSAKLRIIEKK